MGEDGQPPVNRGRGHLAQSLVAPFPDRRGRERAGAELGQLGAGQRQQDIPLSICPLFARRDLGKLPLKHRSHGYRSGGGVVDHPAASNPCLVFGRPSFGECLSRE